MRRALTLFAAAAVCTACVPDLNVKASRIDDTRVVAVRATPAEATPGTTVTWDAIVVTPLSAPAFKIDWAMCSAPRNPADSITVTDACFEPVGTFLDAGAPVGDAGVAPTPVVTAIEGANGARAQAALPSDTCRKVGPEVPMTSDMGQRQRPPDADITGGYQLPIRLQLLDATGTQDQSFDRQRVRCNLAAAPIAAAREFATRYVANENPVIQSVSIDGSQAPADGSVRFAVRRGSRLPMTITWPATTRETYVLFDPVARAIKEKPETLEIAWYTNGGEFERDRTTPDGEGATTTSNELILDGDVAQTVTVWIILRDDRGGVGVSTLFFEVS